MEERKTGGGKESEYVRKISVVSSLHNETRRGIACEGTQSQIISSCEAMGEYAEMCRGGKAIERLGRQTS